MSPRAPSDATDLLLAWSGGDASAFDKLVPLVYQELRVLAQRYMRRERPFAAQTMRRILVEFARNRHRQKRGGDAIHVTLGDAVEMAEEKQADLVALSDALTALASFDARMSQIVELRFFGGLSVQETADVLKVSPETVMRDWKTAKVWLLRELSQEKPAAKNVD
jgi:RNA polymerase sigma-70 factor (ECF subfamily)